MYLISEYTVQFVLRKVQIGVIAAVFTEDPHLNFLLEVIEEVATYFLLSAVLTCK